MLDLTSSRLLEYLPKVIAPALLATFTMVLWSLLIGLVLGSFCAIVLVLTNPRGLAPNAWLYRPIHYLVSFIRSFPILILIVAVGPLSRLLLGVSFGLGAAVLPLSLAISAVIARLFETALNEVDPSVIAAARSFGANNTQIVFRVMVVEALPSITSNLTFVVIQLFNNTAVAGAVGAGGLGAVALTYGDQRFDYPILYGIVVIFSLIIFAVQALGNYLYRQLKVPGV